MLSASCFYNFLSVFVFEQFSTMCLGFMFVLLSCLESVVIPESMGFIDFWKKKKYIYIYIICFLSNFSLCFCLDLFSPSEIPITHMVKTFHFAQYVSSAVFFILSLFLSFFFFFLLLRGGACGILVPPPGIEPMPPTVEVQSPRL